MSTPPAHRATYAKGIAMSAAGMVVISPDGLLIRLVEHAGVWEIVFWRTALTALALAGFLALTRRRRLRAELAGKGGAVLLSSLPLALANFGFVGAMVNTTVANTLVILATMPLFAAVLGWIILGERPAARTWAAIALGVVGVAVIVSGSLGGGSLLGDGLAALTALLHGLNLVLLRRSGLVSVMPVVTAGSLLAALMALPLALPMRADASDLLALAVLGLLVLPVALTLFLGGTRYIAAAEVALLSLVETVLGPLWAWLGVGEVPARAAFLGGAVVFAAIVLNSVLALRGGRRPTGREYPPPPGE